MCSSIFSSPFHHFSTLLMPYKLWVHNNAKILPHRNANQLFQVEWNWLLLVSRLIVHLFVNFFSISYFPTYALLFEFSFEIGCSISLISFDKELNLWCVPFIFIWESSFYLLKCILQHNLIITWLLCIIYMYIYIYMYISAYF